jgi:hypothetical protein
MTAHEWFYLGLALHLILRYFHLEESIPMKGFGRKWFLISSAAIIGGYGVWEDGDFFPLYRELCLIQLVVRQIPLMDLLHDFVRRISQVVVPT